MNPLISVIVPVYKVEPYLDRCVQSIVGQTYKNLEILLVDDGSPDQCPQMCDQWAQRDARIRVIHKENGGLSSARNAGIDAAKGDYLYFVDSDDYIAPSLCERIMDLFAQYDVDIVTFDCCRIDKNGKDMGGTETICDGFLSQEAALEKLMRGHINNYAVNKIYRRRVFDDIRFPEGRVWEDMATAYKLFLQADRIYCCSERLYYYCERGDSITSGISGKALGDIFYARHSSYWELKEIYPYVGELVFPMVALSALRLYDRSLWQRVDLMTLEEAKHFLSENKEKILKDYGNAIYRLYYAAPEFYDVLRVLKHKVGNVVKRIHKK